MSEKPTTTSNETTTSNGTDDTPSTNKAPILGRQTIRGSILVAILCASVYGTKDFSSEGKSRHIWMLVHLLSFSSWFGCSIWVSFIAGIIMFKNLPRHTFGRLQSHLFPAYFQFSALMISIAIVSATALGWWKKNEESGEDGGILSLAAILVTIFANLIYLEPETTRIMFQRHAVERRLGTGHEMGQLKPSDPAKANDPELKALSKKFGMLHGMSSLMNLIALGVGCYWLNFCASQMSC